MKKVSVIVPVYNAENTLTDCLGNLVHQTLEDIELILVNDASTDGSLEILLSCERQFPDKVLLINNTENLGAGGARNLALDMAQGEYVGFVDADDMVDSHMYEKLYTAAKAGDYDIVDCAYLDIKKDKAICLTAEDMTGVLDDEKRSKLITAQGYLCTKLIRRRLFEEPVMLRERERVILEDMDVLTYLYAIAHSVTHVLEILYKYNDRPDSSSKIKQPARYVENILDAMEAVYDKTHALPSYEGIREAVEYAILSLYLNGAVMVLQTRDEYPPAQADHLLRRLAAMRRKTVRAKRCDDNPYVSERFSKQELMCVQEADKMM